MARGEERARKALMTLKDLLGIPPKQLKPVLVSLLKESGNSWELIEADNYSVLIDAFLNSQESQGSQKTARDKGKEDLDGEASEPLKKKQKIKKEDEGVPALHSSELQSQTTTEKLQLDVDDTPPLRFRRRRAEPVTLNNEIQSEPSALFEKSGTEMSREMDLVHPKSYMTDAPFEKESGSLSVLPSRSNPMQPEGPNASGVNSQRARSTERINADKGKDKVVSSPLETYQMKMPTVANPDSKLLYSNKKTHPVLEARSHVGNFSMAPLIPKGEPLDGEFEIPLAVIRPTEATPAIWKGGQTNDSRANSSTRQNLSSSSVGLQSMQVKRLEANSPYTSSKKDNGVELANVHDSSLKTIELASSTTGEVKISLSCSSVRDNFEMPSLETICKLVEDRCLKSYKILQPDFSLVSVMREMCQCVEELSSKTAALEEVNSLNVSPEVAEFLKQSGSKATSESMKGGYSLRTFPNMSCQDQIESTETCGVVTLASPRPPHNVDDITKGEERVKISVVNEVNTESFPTFFHYIPGNIIYQNGYVNISLARIGDEDCCADCFGNCVAASIPCACARETGGEFAYTVDGLIKQQFLDECVSMNQDPHKHRLYFCKDCPLERTKNDNKTEPCKGHLVRKFVKECWSKCGCNKQCGNRVVQRGITRNLQIFYTKERKGWGLRTLEELPKGAFVCEYVGEILTNMELYERTIKTTGNARHTYPVLLDADWGSEGVLKDEEALCLDATFYGNVGRFVNHRCVDANLIEIPVEVETPDHHYYRLAFFTTRKVEALEELTWDYGIDFDDKKHPVKAFFCRCGSKSCRDSRKKARIRFS